MNSRLCSISFFLDCSLSSCRLANIVAVASSSLCQEKQNNNNKKKGTTVRALFLTEINIKAHRYIMSFGISRWLDYRAVQNKAPSFQKLNLLSNQMKFYNFFDAILQPKYHRFSQKHSQLYHNMTQDSSTGMQYTPPNNFPNPVKITDLRYVQARFIFTCLVFKDTGFSLF